MFSLKNVSKSFGDMQVLKPTTVDFRTGESTVLIGPSGCGKSTLLRILVGLLAPDSGIIEFDNTLVTSKNIEILRQKMGYVIQDGGLFPHLTARQNVGLLASHLGWNTDKVRARVDELGAGGGGMFIAFVCERCARKAGGGRDTAAFSRHHGVDFIGHRARDSRVRTHVHSFL